MSVWHSSQKFFVFPKVLLFSKKERKSVFFLEKMPSICLHSKHQKGHCTYIKICFIIISEQNFVLSFNLLQRQPNVFYQIWGAINEVGTILYNNNVPRTQDSYVKIHQTQYSSIVLIIGSDCGSNDSNHPIFAIKKWWRFL